MRFSIATLRRFLVFALAAAWLPTVAAAHCDTADGPVVLTAKAALEKGDVTPILKWVKPAAELEIRAAFARTERVRQASPEAKALADDYFFETLVRVHREGEGAPYTGIRPAGTPIDPGIELADQSLETADVERLIAGLTSHVESEIRGRFARTLEAKRHAEESVEKGRAFVASYVDYMHFVERLHLALTTSAAHDHASAEH